MSPCHPRTWLGVCLSAALAACNLEQPSEPARPPELRLPALSRAVRTVSGRDAGPFVLAALHARAAEDPDFAPADATGTRGTTSGSTGLPGPVARDVVEEYDEWWTLLRTIISSGDGFGSIAAEMHWKPDNVLGAEQNMTWIVMNGTKEEYRDHYTDTANSSMLGANAHEFYSYHAFNVSVRGSCVWLKGTTNHGIERPSTFWNYWSWHQSSDSRVNPCPGGYTGDYDSSSGDTTLVCFEEWLQYEDTEIYVGDVCYTATLMS